MSRGINAEGGRATSSQVALAAGLLLIELLAGIQTYLSQTVLPLMAAELDASRCTVWSPLPALSPTSPACPWG